MASCWPVSIRLVGSPPARLGQFQIDHSLLLGVGCFGETGVGFEAMGAFLCVWLGLPSARASCCVMRVWRCRRQAVGATSDLFGDVNELVPRDRCPSLIGQPRMGCDGAASARFTRKSVECLCVVANLFGCQAAASNSTPSEDSSLTFMARLFV